MPVGDEPPPGVSNVNPVRAVDKKGKDRYRIIQNVRLANLGVVTGGTVGRAAIFGHEAYQHA